MISYGDGAVRGETNYKEQMGNKKFMCESVLSRARCMALVVEVGVSSEGNDTKTFPFD